jgi:hypothetical protein
VTAALWKTWRRLGLGRRAIPLPSVAPFVNVAVPSISEDEWRKHGSLHLFCSLFLTFARGHEWALVSSAIDFGEEPRPGEETTDAIDVASALLVVAKETGHTIEQLHAMRLEGFYTLVEALRRKASRNAEPVESTLPQGIGFEKDSTGLFARLSRAEVNDGGQG